MTTTTYHQTTPGDWSNRRCTCGRSFNTARGQRMHLYAEARKRRTCERCGNVSHRENRVRNRLCELCTEDLDAREDDLR